MLNLTKEQMERRNALLKELYDEGYRYISNSESNIILAGEKYGKKNKSLGLWSMKNAKFVLNKDTDEDLFPDVKWEDEEVFDIEAELNK